LKLTAARLLSNAVGRVRRLYTADSNLIVFRRDVVQRLRRRRAVHADGRVRNESRGEIPRPVLWYPRLLISIQPRSTSICRSLMSAFHPFRTLGTANDRPCRRLRFRGNRCRRQAPRRRRAANAKELAFVAQASVQLREPFPEHGDIVRIGGLQLPQILLVNVRHRAGFDGFE